MNVPVNLAGMVVPVLMASTLTNVNVHKDGEDQHVKKVSKELPKVRGFLKKIKRDFCQTTF